MTVAAAAVLAVAIPACETGRVPEGASTDAGTDADATARPAATLTVVEVTDGDTLTARDATGRFRVRLAQVDAPEMPDECYSAEAAEALRSMAGPGTAIRLRRPGPPFVDGSGRRLGEVLTEDGASVNVELVRRGHAAWGSRFADEDPDLARRLRDAERQARSAEAGLWAACGAPHVSAACATPSGQRRTRRRRAVTAAASPASSRPPPPSAPA